MSHISLIASMQAFFIALLLILTPFIARLNAGSIVAAIPDSRERQEEPPPAQASDAPPPILKALPDARYLAKRFAHVSGKTLQTPPDGIVWLAAVERKIFDLSNAERTKRKLTPLIWDNGLQKSSRIHSVDMIRRNFFDHISPDGNSPFDRIAILHRQLIGTAGENIWMSVGISSNSADKLARQVMKDWMNSPGHKANILRAVFSHLGVGAAKKGDKIEITQNFSATQAFLTAEMPLNMHHGDRFDFTIKPFLQRRRPIKYEYLLSDKGVKAYGPYDIKDNIVKNTIVPGNYRLRFYFAAANKGYVIYPGPQVLIDK